MSDNGPTVQFGNREVTLADLLCLTALAGPVGEDDKEPDTIFLRFEKATYSRDDVLKIVQAIARMQPDECDMSEDDLRLWWD